MNFTPVWIFDNYVSAHIAMGRLKEEDIECWLKDENTVTIDPILTNAVGGIKLMVDQERAADAFALLKQLENKHKSQLTCSKCGSSNVELVSTPRKPLNWFAAISTFFLGDRALAVEKVYHCFDCGHESSTAILNRTNDLLN